MVALAKKTRSPLYVYWQAAIPEWGKLSATLVLACLAAILGIVPYILTWYIALEVLTKTPEVDRIFWLTGVIFGSVILHFMVQGGVTVLGHMAGFRAEWRLRCQLIERVKDVSPLALEGKSAQLSRAVMDEVGRLNGILAHTLPDIVSGLFLTLVSVVILFWMDWRLTLAALAMFLLGMWAQKRSDGISPAFFERWAQTEGRVASTLLFYLRGLVTLRAFNRQASSLQEVKESIAAVGKLGREIVRIFSMTIAIFGLAMTTPLLVVLPCAFIFYTKGTLALSDLLFFLAVSGVIFLPLTKVAMSLRALQNLQAGAQQIQAMLDLPVLNVARILEPVKDTEITFENVSYDVKSTGSEKVSLVRNVSFTLPSGSVTTVTGPSGSGKTTLARLLARLDDVSDGRILIGGQDIRSIHPQELQRLVSIVFQDSHLFHGTIRDNILLARPQATESELVQAVEEAGCGAMLKAFPLGLDTPVGDNGIGLSGGEQQRIAIARAFLKDAPILILDEVTAHLDPIVAQNVTQSLNRLMTKKTVFAISHRLNDIENSDTTLVIVDGCLEEKGTHGELLIQSSVYKRLWTLQEQSHSWRFGKERTQGGQS